MKAWVDEFCRAIVAKDEKKVLAMLMKSPELLNANESLISDGKNTLSPLWIAVTAGCEDIVELLIKYGADVNKYSSVVSDAGGDADGVTILKRSILHWMAMHSDLCQERQLKIIEILIKHGADINAFDPNDVIGTPLQCALIEENIKVVELLLKNGAKLDGIEWEGKTPAGYICQGSSENVKEMLLLLLKYGLDYNYRDEEGNNLIHYFVCHFKNDHHNAADMVKILISCGVPFDEVDSRGLAPLLRAIYQEDIQLVSFLISNGSDVNQKNTVLEMFPLFVAVMVKNDEIINLLLLKGAKIDAKMSSGKTALHEACSTLQDKIINLLLQKGANFNAEDNEGQTPLFYLNKNADNYDQCLITVVKKISKSAFESFKISDKNMKFIKDDSNVHKHFKNCTAELVQMVKTELYPPYSMYSVLKMSIKIEKLALFLKNKDLVLKFEKNLPLLFYYKNDVEKVFKEASEIKDKLETIDFKLKSIFHNHLPDLVLRVLAKNLVDEDLPIE